MLIKKVDYYCGAFLSYLIFNGVNEPTLFEAGEKSRVVRFSVRNDDYKAFIKYSTVANSSIKSNKHSTRWDANFTQKEVEFLFGFQETGRNNIVILICTDENMKNTFFPVLTYSEALTCLGTDIINKQKRISVVHLKSSPYINFYGTALSDLNSLQKDYNSDKFFGFDA